VVYISYLTLQFTYGYTFFDRLSFQSKSEDVETISFREKNLQYSLDLGIKNFLTGVGLGNYYNNLPIHKLNNPEQISIQAPLALASQNPHNIFAQILAETGIISLFFYIFMLLYFAIYDFKILLSKKDNLIYNKGFAISFWTLTIYSFFNPSIGLTYNLLFWGLRVFI